MSKKGKEKPGAFNMAEKLRRVKVLQQTNRIKEAIAYIFLMFVDVLKDKFGDKVWRPSFTMREFAIRLVKSRQVHMEPEKIYPFITHLEQVLYGGEPVTEAKLEETKQYFQNLYKTLQTTTAQEPAVETLDSPIATD
ncbi:MAG TPA: DUF4129 domain-containing protein [Candidatus Lokiarchaeia archaeon]|nr:DUF4129 domain-containing protein [Candidatus Lokiarchaeia archaeon]